MGNAELKLDIFRIVDQLPESELQKLYGMISELTNQDTTSLDSSPWSRLSEGEQAAIEKGLSQLERGQGISHAEVMSDFRKKLSRRKETC